MLKNTFSNRFICLILITAIALPLASPPGTTFSLTYSLLYNHHSISSLQPGDIQKISTSDPYPTVGKPVRLTLTIQGNPGNVPFNETVTLTDHFLGLVQKGDSYEWSFGSVVIDQFSLTIGRKTFYRKTVIWYPVFVGHHLISCTRGSSSMKNISLDVHFDSAQIIAPSLGNPAIIKKNTSSLLHVVLSEQRLKTESPSYHHQLRLEETTNSTRYYMVNTSHGLTEYGPIDENSVQDIVTLSFDVQNVPAGFYNMTITSEKINYSWPHAVSIIEQDPAEFRIVQLTDIHIGKAYNTIDEQQRLQSIIKVLNTVVHPDFIILTGDSVDWDKQNENQNFYTELQSVLIHCDAPVFTTLGNHERYVHRLVGLYAPYWDDLVWYHRFLNPLDDYTHDYGGFRFVFLDSGYDNSRWEATPESTGLTNTQMYLLQQVWGNTTHNQIIAMHHLAVNDRNDTGLNAVQNTLPSGNDQCIAFNRGQFLDFCLNNLVQLVLAGHSHVNRVFTINGTQPNDPLGWPLFLQTTTATLNPNEGGGRIISIVNGSVQSYDFIKFI
jgi:predicted MPP superfamily phosphohydrolase